jgi:hypothetical protein
MAIAIIGLNSASSLQIQPVPMRYDTDIIDADTPQEVEKRRKAFLRKWRVRHSGKRLAIGLLPS